MKEYNLVQRAKNAMQRADNWIYRHAEKVGFYGGLASVLTGLSLGGGGAYISAESSDLAFAVASTAILIGSTASAFLFKGMESSQLEKQVEQAEDNSDGNAIDIQLLIGLY